ncbi:hypothetical protein KI387_031526, partial [Taxus chinensis]
MDEKHTAQVAELKVVVRAMQAQMRADAKRKRMGGSILPMSEIEKMEEFMTAQASVDIMEGVCCSILRKRKKEAGMDHTMHCETMKRKVSWNKRTLNLIEEALIEGRAAKS